MKLICLYLWTVHFSSASMGCGTTVKVLASSMEEAKKTAVYTPCSSGGDRSDIYSIERGESVCYLTYKEKGSE